MAQVNPKTSEILENAKKLYHQWKFDESRELFSKLADSPANSDDGYYGLGVIDLQSGKLDAAAKNFNYCLKENPTHDDALFYLGQIYIQKGEYSKALVYLQKTLKFNPKHKAGLRQRQNLLLHLLNQGKLLYRLGRLKESEDIFNEVIDAGQFEAAGHYGIGVIKFQKGQLDEAERYFRKCTQLHDRHANALYYQGRIAEKQKEPDAAEQFYRKALRINPQHNGANYRVVNISKQFEEAHPQMKNAIPPIAKGPITENDAVPDDPTPQPQVQNDQVQGDSFKLPQNRRPYISAFAGKILFWALLDFFLYTQISFVKYKYDIYKGNMLTFLVTIIFICLVLYILKIKRTVYTFHPDATLSIESGLFGSSIKTYDLRGLQSVEPRRNLVNQLTGDGTLILKIIVSVAGRGNVLTRLSLKGMGKWDELKEISEELNGFIASGR